MFNKNSYLYILLFLVGLSLGYLSPKYVNLFGFNGPEKAYYDILGTTSASSTPVSLTSTSTATQLIIPIDKLENLHLDMDYTPATTSAYMVVEIEGSRDCSAPWFPISTQLNNSTDIRVFATSTLSGVRGTPIIFPGGGYTATGTRYMGSYDQDILAGCARITVRENATSGFGSAYVAATFSSKN